MFSWIAAMIFCASQGRDARKEGKYKKKCSLARKHG